MVFLLTFLWLLLLTQMSWSQVSVTQDGQRVVMENEYLHVVVTPSGGGRIAEFVNKKTGRNMIALWKGDGEIGGALDDRLVFTSLPYQFGIMQPAGSEGILHMEAKHISGLSLVKSLSLKQGQSVLRVTYEFRNGTQQPHPLWIRNFLIPGGPPLTEQHIYFIPQKSNPVAGKPFVGEYFSDLGSPWAALRNTITHENLQVIAPGVEKFYFWQGSLKFPTFEWIYPNIPAGKAMAVNLALVVINDPNPDFDKQAQAIRSMLHEPRTSDLPGWVDEATRFAVTEYEHNMGFWLSIGRGKGKQRLASKLYLDLPLEEERAIYVGVNILKDLPEATVTAGINGDLIGWVQPAWEVSAENSISIEPVTVPRKSRLMAGAEQRIWLNVNARGRKAGNYEGRVWLTINAYRVIIPMRVRIWPVRVPVTRPFDVRGYATMGDFTGGYDTKPETLKRMDALLRLYSQMGGSVLDWTVMWSSVLAHVKIAGTGEILTNVAAKHPEQLSLDRLPALDFSYFDPWLEIAKRHGVTRVETYLDSLDNSAWQWRLLDPAIGKGRVKVGSPEAEQVIGWILRELKRYFGKHGFRGYFCKIGDEISPEHLPAHIAAAKVARAAGWRPFTTITGLIARTAQHITAINPYCDQWQLAMCLKDDFRKVLQGRYRMEWREADLRNGWAAYGNGGAQETWGVRLFGGVVAEPHDDVEKVDVIEDGKPLQERGGSPWGNRERGIFFRLGPYLYFSPSDGRKPDDHLWKVRYWVRVPDPKGKSLTSIDREDEIWFYGGGSYPFRIAYENALVYPLLAAVEGYQGYGWWAFQWWQPSEKIVWYDASTQECRVGPTFLGLRDGWRDACLYYWVMRERKVLSPNHVASERHDALLQFGETSSEVYRWRTIVNMDSPLTAHRLRRSLLEVMMKQRPEQPAKRRARR